MKTAASLAGFCAVLGATALLAHADGAPTPATLKAAAAQEAPVPAVAPATPFDAGDFSTTDPEEIARESMAIRDERESEPNLQAFDQSQKQKAYDNDWMLRDYTAQLKKEGLANTPETDPSLVPQPADPDATHAYKDPLLPENQVAAKPDTSRPTQDDPTTQLAPMNSLSPVALQPLLPPLNPSVKVPMVRNAWGSPTPATTDDDTSTDPAAAFPPAPITHNLGSLDDSVDSLLDSPGMTAQREGLVKNSDLSFQDEPPDEDTDRAAPHVNRATNFLVPTAPTSDITDFFKKQAEALQPPTAPTAAQPMEAATAPKPLAPLDAPEPFAKPPVSGLRSHVADPFDILNR